MTALSREVQSPIHFNRTRCSQEPVTCLRGWESCRSCAFRGPCSPLLSENGRSAPVVHVVTGDKACLLPRQDRGGSPGEGGWVTPSCPSAVPRSRCPHPVLAGVADEEAFLEECRQRGQHALPSQAASTSASARPLRSQKPVSLPRHASPPYVGEDEDQQDRHRATGIWDPSVFSAGVQRETEAGRPLGDASLASQGQRGQKVPLCCCVLT